MINLWPVENGKIKVNVAIDTQLGKLKRQFITYADFASMLKDISSELSCIQFEPTPVNNTQPTGILITKGSRCFTALGHAPGFVGDSTELIEERFNIGQKWQIISINQSCSTV